MNALVTVVVFLAMIALGAWIISRAAVRQHESVATHPYSRVQRPPGSRGPRLPVLPQSRRGTAHVQGFRAPAPSTPAAAPNAVHHGPSVGDQRRDHRDGGRGR